MEEKEIGEVLNNFSFFFLNLDGGSTPLGVPPAGPGSARGHLCPRCPSPRAGCRARAELWLFQPHL